MALTVALEYEPGFSPVAEVSNGLEAIEACREHQPDAILLDLSMPVMDGITAIAGIREVSPRTQVVVFSGSVERRQEALRAGADCFVLKGAGLREALDFLRP